MKSFKFQFVAALFVFSFASCKKDTTELPDTPAGIYETAIYSDNQITLNEVTYGIRPNFNNIQYTSENTKAIEITQPTLYLKLDLYTAPIASANKKQPLLVMIHGGGFSAAIKMPGKMKLIPIPMLVIYVQHLITGSPEMEVIKAPN